MRPDFCVKLLKNQLYVPISLYEKCLGSLEN